MSNETNGVPGIDNLTPFEYALAGVTPPGDQDSPSLAVIEGMRQLAAEVEDAPVTDARLQEFIRDGGANQRRNDRRALKRRRPMIDEPADGGFVDITPIELVSDRATGSDIEPTMFQDTEPTSEQPAVFLPVDDQAANVLADAGADADADGPGLAPAPTVGSDTDPTIDDQAIGTPPMEIAAAAHELVSDDQRGEDRSENGTDRTDDGHHDPAAGVAAGLGLNHLDESDFARKFDAIQQAMVGEAASSEAGTEPETDHIAGARGPAEAEFGLGSELDSELGGSMESGGDSRSDLQPAGDPDHQEQDLSAPLTEAVLFDRNDSTDGEAEPTEDPLWDQNPAGGPLLLAGDDNDRSPVPVAALTEAPPLPGRRVGAAFWALAGTATAALLLGLGGYVWLNSISDESAQDSAASSVEASGSTENEPEAPASEPSSDDGSTSEASATGALGEGDEEREPLAVDGVDTPEDDNVITPTTTDDSNAQAGADGNTDDDPNPETDQTPTTAEDETSVTETTVAETTAPETTVTPTTEPPITEPPTTPPPATEPPTTPPTTPPTIGPTFIGDRITLGSYEGPGLDQVRVLIYQDRDSNGTPDELVGQTSTANGGFYAFDRYPTGCYVIQFDQLPFKVEVRQDHFRQPVCLQEGGQNGRIDAVAIVSPPDGCLVEADTGSSRQGVEVYDSDGYQQQNFVFYDQVGNVVVRTRDIGGPDDFDGINDFEWFGRGNGFSHRQVFTVAGEYNGVESQPVACSRASFGG